MRNLLETAILLSTSGSAHASYDDNGNLDGIKASNGGSIERGESGSWHTVDERGEPTPPIDGRCGQHQF